LVVQCKGPVWAFVNGHQAAAAGSDREMHVMRVMLHPGDFLIIRTTSDLVYRGVRTAYVGGNGVGTFGGVPSRAVMDTVGDLNASVPTQPFKSMKITVGKDDHKEGPRWQEAGLPADAKPIALPAKHVFYDIGYVVPN
jgi:hypothetical protein